MQAPPLSRGGGCSLGLSGYESAVTISTTSDLLRLVSRPRELLLRWGFSQVVRHTLPRSECFLRGEERGLRRVVHRL